MYTDRPQALTTLFNFAIFSSSNSNNFRARQRHARRNHRAASTARALPEGQIGYAKAPEASRLTPKATREHQAWARREKFALRQDDGRTGRAEAEVRGSDSRCPTEVEYVTENFSCPSLIPFSPQASKALCSNGSWASSRRKRNSGNRCWAKSWKYPTSSRLQWARGLKSFWRRRTRRLEICGMSWRGCRRLTTTCSRFSKRKWWNTEFRLKSLVQLCHSISQSRQHLEANVNKDNFKWLSTKHGQLLQFMNQSNEMFLYLPFAQLKKL